jgi:hypothetical protein
MLEDKVCGISLKQKKEATAHEIAQDYFEQIGNVEKEYALVDASAFLDNFLLNYALAALDQSTH